MKSLIPIAQMRNHSQICVPEKITLPLVESMDWRKPMGVQENYKDVSGGDGEKGLEDGWAGFGDQLNKGMRETDETRGCPGFCLGCLGQGGVSEMGNTETVLWGSDAKFHFGCPNQTSSCPKAGGRGKTTLANFKSWHCCYLWPRR